MLVETRVLGKRSRSLDRWSIPTAPDEPSEGEALTLRALITRTVIAEVTAFESRERARRLVRVLSESEMAAGAQRGRIDPGGRDAAEPVDVDHAVAAALQGFVDGLYLVILDGTELRDLDALVFPTPTSTLVFLRLTFLAGA